MFAAALLGAAAKKADFVNIKLRTEVPNADVAAADAVWLQPGQ